MTKKDHAYNFIRSEIAGRRLLPGQRITANQVAAEIGSSAMPVREALLSLEADGIVTITPYVGAVVVDVSSGAMRELIHVLGVLEAYATAEAFVRSPGLAEVAAKWNDELREAVTGEDHERFVDLDRVFHLRVCEGCGNDQLLENVALLWRRLDAMAGANSRRLPPNRFGDEVQEHERLVELFSDRRSNPLEVELAVRRHRWRLDEVDEHVGRGGQMEREDASQSAAATH